MTIDPTLSSKFFQEFAAMLSFETGWKVSTDYSIEDTWVLNYVSWKEGRKVPKYIVIQTEPEFRITGDYMNFLAGAEKVLDYRKDFTFGYSVFYRLQMEEAKDIDVLFFGAMNDRRKEICDAVNATVVDAYGAELMKYVMRSKIVLCVNYHEDDSLMPRIAQLLSVGAFVIAEDPPEPYANCFSFVTASYESLVKAIERYLLLPTRRLSYIDSGLAWIQTQKQTSDFAL